MGKRNRGAGRISAPSTDYRDADGNVLTLKGSMSPLTRRKYASTLHDQRGSTDDSWHRAVEFLFERLVERWEVYGVPTEGQQELLQPLPHRDARREALDPRRPARAPCRQLPRRGGAVAR